jgi:hypothetical protein
MDSDGLFRCLSLIRVADRCRIRAGGSTAERTTPQAKHARTYSAVVWDAGVVRDRERRIWRCVAGAAGSEGGRLAAIAIVGSEKVVRVDVEVGAVVPDSERVLCACLDAGRAEHEGNGFALSVGRVVLVEVADPPLAVDVGPLIEADLHATLSSLQRFRANADRLTVRALGRRSAPAPAIDPNDGKDQRERDYAREGDELPVATYEHASQYSCMMYVPVDTAVKGRTARLLEKGGRTRFSTGLATE